MRIGIIIFLCHFSTEKENIFSYTHGKVEGDLKIMFLIFVTLLPRDQIYKIHSVHLQILQFYLFLNKPFKQEEV